MLNRKPRKGNVLLASKGNDYPVVEWVPVGTVDRVEGNICHYTDTGGMPQAFIWWFESDRTYNRLHRIKEETDEGVSTRTVS